MFNRHGDVNTEAALGQRAITPEDVARIPNVISDPDKVTLSTKKDASGRKDLGDIFVTVQAVSDGTHSIQADTLYIKKKNSQGTVSDNGAYTPSPNTNVRNVPPQSSSDLNIAQTPPESNLQQAGSRSETSPALRALDDALSRRSRVPTSEAAALLSRTSRRRRLTPSIPLWSGGVPPYECPPCGPEPQKLRKIG